MSPILQITVDHPAGTHLEASGPVFGKKPNIKPSSALRDIVIRRMRPTTRAAATSKGESYGSNAGTGPAAATAGGEDKDPPSLMEYRRKHNPPPQNDTMNVKDSLQQFLIFIHYLLPYPD